MTLVAGVDSSTQSCTVVVRDAATGELVRSGRAPHPPGTEVDPQGWWTALQAAVADAGGLDGVAALSVSGQQHGMVCLSADGEVVRPALLWNDVRSAGAAADLVDELGARAWADATGSVPVASITATKLRWLATQEPEHAAATAAVCLPHDWLTWKLRGTGRIDDLVTDRSDASGTGYWGRDGYRLDLLGRALGRDDVVLPRVLGPAEEAGRTPDGVLLGPGTGDNAGAALGLGAAAGDVVVSLGTSGVVSAVSPVATADPTGIIAGFASATGDFLPLACTLNAARVLDGAARMLGVDHDGLSRLALEGPSGAGGLVLVPYLEGERTPNRPDATGSLHGLTLATTTPAHLARAAVEGLLCGLADALDALVAAGVEVRRVFLVGGAARSGAVAQIAPAVLGHAVLRPTPGEYVADGAARQAAWVLAGGDAPPEWAAADLERFEVDPAPAVRERYAAARDHVLPRV